MLWTALFVLDQQRPRLPQHPGAMGAYRAAVTFWKHHHGEQLIKDVRDHLAGRRMRQAAGSSAWLLALAVGGRPRAPRRLGRAARGE
jgi:hypothetical protein